MSIYDWKDHAADNAASDEGVYWNIGQLAGFTNGSMRVMMQRIREYIGDGALHKTTELAGGGGFCFSPYSKLKQLEDGARFRIIMHRDVKDSDRIRLEGIAQDKGGEICIYNELSGTSDKVKARDLVAQGCYEIIYQAEKGNWLVVNYPRQIKLDSIEVGTIVPFAGNNTPKNWLICQGQQLLKKQYPELAAVLAQKWGKASKGEDYFLLPDFRAMFLRSFDAGRGIDKGREFASFQDSDNKQHAHEANCEDAGSHSHECLIYNQEHHDMVKPRLYVRRMKTGTYQEFGGSHGQVDMGGLHKHKITISDEKGVGDMRPVNYAVNYLIKAQSD